MLHIQARLRSIRYAAYTSTVTRISILMMKNGISATCRIINQRSHFFINQFFMHWTLFYKICCIYKYGCANLYPDDEDGISVTCRIISQRSHFLINQFFMHWTLLYKICCIYKHGYANLYPDDEEWHFSYM